MSCARSATADAHPSPPSKNANGNGQEFNRSRFVSIRSSDITSKSQNRISANVPSDYERKQTLVNAERFTTPELKDYETKVLTAQERCVEIEKRIFAELRRRLMESAGRIRKTSTARCGDRPAGQLRASGRAAKLHPASARTQFRAGDYRRTSSRHRTPPG